MTERYEDRRVYWVWLGMVFGAGSPLLWRLCRGYEHIWGFAEELSEGRLDAKLTEAQRQKCREPFSKAAEIIERCENKGIKVLSFRSEGFPERLRRIPSPPAALFVRGDEKTASPDNPSVLFVGTRNPTAYSVRIAERLAGELAERGITVISGIEDGIDAVACEAAAVKGRAAAVCGRGIMSDHYSPEQLDKTAASGAVIAEFTGYDDYGRVPFDKRNRLLCGLADAVVFIECRADSSGLNNVAHAQQLGRPILAVPPADICDARFFGQRDLLRAGASAVFSADDIAAAVGCRAARDEALAEIGGRKQRRKPKKELSVPEKVKEERTNTKNEQKNVNEGLHKSEMSATIDMSGFSEEQRKIWELLTQANRKPMHINRLAELSGLSITQLVEELVELRMEGLVAELAGKRYIRNV